MSIIYLSVFNSRKFLMIICFDIETTGLDKYNDRIIEIALVKFDKKNFKVLDKYSCLINPEIDIPEVISNITGIFNDDVKEAPKIGEIKDEISNFIWDLPVLWHNVDFDIGFLQANGVDLSQNIKIDTFLLANILLIEQDSLNLEMLCINLWIDFEWAHRALNDALATVSLFQRQVELFNSLAENEKNIMHYIFSISNDRNIKYLEDLFFSFFTQTIGFQGFENTILKKVWKKPYSKQFFSDDSLECEDIVKMFDFWLEHRENQIKMAKTIEEAYQNKKKVLIEAPTWLWKSFAYLVPSIIHSVKNNEKIYISTKTKALQDQLFFKDLELLNKNLWIDFSYSKLKWKKNYISLKWFFDYILLWNLDYEEVFFLIKVSFWLLKTEYWELDELNFFPFEYTFLRSLNTIWFENIKEKNPYFAYEFLTKAREALVNSNITIINHSLLFASVESDIDLLPNLKNLVLDEAHNIEDSVTEALKKSYNFLVFKEYLEKCDRIIKAKNIKKIKFSVLKEEVISKLIILDDYSNSYLSEKLGNTAQYKTLLVKEDYFSEWNYMDLVKKISLDFIDIIDYLKTITEFDFSKEIDYFEDILYVLWEFLSEKNNNTLIKVISSTDKSWISYYLTYLNVWDFLENKIWSNLNTCVLTSATLSIWWKFDYFDKILNLKDFDFYLFDSDFDYKSQATLFIPTDIWNIKNNSHEIISFLKDFFLTVKWRTLTLFTNFAIIKQVYTDCMQVLKKQWINLYAQSIWWSKVKLFSLYKESPANSILLWTDSFWEWIDIPWEDLKYLIIHKFPFQVPTDPIFQARSAFFKDSFSEYSIPKAIIKLKQWFWRLIRTKEDKWLIILLDNRINTEWWLAFYDAFPKNINIKKWTKQQLLKILEEKT